MAIDGRWGLRWPRDARGEYVYRVITELGFLPRPYDLKVFGDQSAHPDVVKKVGLLHPVEILMSPNDWVWEQSAFAQAARGTQLIHATTGSVPLTTRITRVVTVYPERLARPLYTRMLRRTPALFVLSDGAAHTQARPLPTTEIPLAPLWTIARPVFPKDSYMLVEDADPAALEFACRLVSALRDPPLTLRIVVHAPREEDQTHRIAKRLGATERVELVVAQSPQDLAEHYQRASCVLIGSTNESAWLSGLNAAAIGTPIVAWDQRAGLSPVLADVALRVDGTAVHDAAASVQQFLHDFPLQRTWVEAAQNRVRTLTWKQAAELTDQTYRKVLGIGEG